LMSASMARRRFSLSLMSMFAVLALLLAAIGMYGVMTLVVTQRTQEFGVRLALGAEPRDIVKLVLRPCLILTAMGTALGLAVSFGAARLMSTLVFGVSANDPRTFVAVPALLAIIALSACSIPAMRAARVSPIESLRS
ncbi:MAG: FtsX-like permease family protein, partial [Vicinamibacterales bacterium]